MVMMAGMDEHERKVVVEFNHLLEKSKQLFNGLRDLPQYGHKQWQAYFGRTFDIYTKLWKFQQQHRLVRRHEELPRVRCTPLVIHPFIWIAIEDVLVEQP